MINPHVTPFYRRILFVLPLVILAMVVVGFAVSVLLARQEGLQPGPAVIRAVHQLPTKALPMLIGFALAWGLALLVYSRRPDQQASAVESGRVMWQRIRLWSTVLMAPFLLLAAVAMVYHLATGQWQDLDWILVFLFALFCTVLVSQWLHHPTRERLYAMGSGDESRVKDERMQLVQGKAAGITLSLFAGLLLIVGTLYETIVLGRWPVLTGIEFVILAAIWITATTYWDRKL